MGNAAPAAGAASADPSPRLEAWSCERTASALSGLGSAYQAYANAVRDNGVDGALLASLDEPQLEETLQDLGILNRLHRRVLLQKIRDISPRFEGSTTTTGDSRADGEDDELQVFDELVEEALNKSPPTVIYAGVHLVPNTDEGGESGRTAGVGHVVLSGSLRRTADGETLRLPRFSGQPVEESTCYHFVRERADTFYETVLPDVKTWASGSCYSGYALVDERKGSRVGCICLVDSAGRREERSSEKEALMKELAAVAESQIKRKNALLTREAGLRNQIKHALDGRDLSDFINSGDPKRLKVARDSSGSTLNRSEEGNDLSDDIKIGVDDKAPKFASENSNTPLSHRKDTATEARYHEPDRAGEEEVSHLSPNFFDAIDSVGAPRPPIAKDDMQSIAAAQELDYRSIVVRSNIGEKIKKFVRMACKLVDFPMGSLAFHDHFLQYHVGSYAEKPEHAKIFETAFDVLQRNDDGSAFACQKDRGSAICNYPLFLKETFVIREMAEDETFSWLAEKVGLHAYIGSPLVDDAGRVIANLCLYDFRAHPELDRRSEVMLEQICLLILQELHVWSMSQKVDRLEKERSKLLSHVGPLKTKPPEGEATIVLTDIEGSTALWEADSHAMQSALETHDQIIQKCTREHNGYVITTEGDAWFLAFHDPVDALAFALKAQCQLYNASWEPGILELENAREVIGSFRGLRVRMGIHHDRVDTSQNEVSRRIEYSGRAWNLARSIEAMSHGGQIVTSVETWNLASSLGDQEIGAFQVLDLGTHVLHVGSGWKEGVVSKGIVQVVPEALSFAYFKARRSLLPSEDDDEPLPVTTTSATLQGRQFPPPVTKCQMGPSFHDAPFANNVATIMFLCAEEIERVSNDFPSVRNVLVRSISDLLVKHGRGYHCQSFMLSFAIEEDAIRFGLKFLEVLKEHEAKKSLGTDGVSAPLSSLIKFGCVTGHFLSMGPHHHSGRADYFGKVVNRTARVAHSAAAGSVYLGVSGAAKPAAKGIGFVYVGIKPLKGVREDIALYECKKKKKKAVE